MLIGSLLVVYVEVFYNEFYVDEVFLIFGLFNSLLRREVEYRKLSAI